jgi:hypothetical protein
VFQKYIEVGISLAVWKDETIDAQKRRKRLGVQLDLHRVLSRLSLLHDQLP